MQCDVFFLEVSYNERWSRLAEAYIKRSLLRMTTSSSREVVKRETIVIRLRGVTRRMHSSQFRHVIEGCMLALDREADRWENSRAPSNIKWRLIAVCLM